MNLTPEVISAIDRLCDLAEHGGGHPLDKEAAELVRRELNVKKRSDSYKECLQIYEHKWDILKNYLQC